MERSPTLAELAKALAKAQGAMTGAAKDKTNPFFKQNYADLASVWDAIREPFAANGLSVTQTTAPTENGVVVETMLLHSSGEWIMGSLRMPITKADPQSYGSALTYCRRYALAAITGVAPEDDDANAASAPTFTGVHKPKEKEVNLTNNFKFLQTMEKEKARVGEVAYYGVLKEFKFEHANEITKREDQLKIYNILSDIEKGPAKEEHAG